MKQKTKYQLGEKVYTAYDPMGLQKGVDPILECTVESISYTIRANGIDYEVYCDDIRYQLDLNTLGDSPFYREEKEVHKTKAEAQEALKKLLEVQITKLEFRLKKYKQLRDRKIV